MAHLTKKALCAIKQSEVIVGYTTYIGLLDKDLLREKKVISF